MDRAESRIRRAFHALAEIDRVRMQPEGLVEDVVVLFREFSDEGDRFERAVANTAIAIEQARDGRVTPAKLRNSLQGWNSLHYQSAKGQGAPADMRLVYRIDSDGRIAVKCFGHRYRPVDIYKRFMHDSAKRV